MSMTCVTFVSATSIRIDAAFAHTVIVDMQHDAMVAASRSFWKDALEDVNDKLHGGVVVVQYQDSIEAWLFGFRSGAGDDRRAATGTALAVIVLHPPIIMPHS
jgi:hypothetical protein